MTAWTVAGQGEDLMFTYYVLDSGSLDKMALYPSNSALRPRNIFEGSIVGFF